MCSTVPGLSVRVGGQIHDELHAHGPVADVVAVRQTELFVKLAANRADRAVTNHRERGVDVHAGGEAIGGIAFFVHALIEQADTNNFFLLNERQRNRRAGPDLDGAGALQLRADPLHELAHRKNHAVVLVQKRRRPRQIQRVLLERQGKFCRANQFIREVQRHRAAARAVRVEQIQSFFLAHRRGHRDAGGFDFWKTRLQRPRPRDDAGHAKADVVRAFVAQNLRRHAGHDGAFNGGRAVGVDEFFGQRGKKSRRGRAKADADDVGVHARAFNL